MKKVLSVVLAIMMLLSCMVTGGSAFADEAEGTTVTLAAIVAEDFVATPEAVTVTADLSDRYADQVGYNDTVTAPSVLDAAIAAHLLYFGDDFMDYAPLTIGDSGWITDFFGMGSGLTYWQNHSCLSSLDTALEEGAYVAFCFYSDTSNWSDLYVYADALSVETAVGKKTAFTFKAVGWGDPFAAGGLSVVIDGKTVGATDESGCFSYVFDTPGKHTVTASGRIGTSPIFKPWCTVNVTYLSSYVNRQIQAGGDYLTRGYSAFEVKDAVRLATLVLEDYDVSAYMEGFVDSVTANLAENGGKLLSPYSGKEDLGLYGAVIIALYMTGYDPCNVGCYDLFAAFDAADLDEARTNPYYYRFAIEVADDEKGKKLCQDLIDNYYTVGQGMTFSKEYPFYCCDNTSYFLMAISKYADEFPEYTEDAKQVIYHYTEDNGARNDDGGMVPDVNADSTALAMGAFAAIGDFDTAFFYYKNLVTEFESATGIFTLDGEEDYYATADAAVGLAYFKREVEDGNYEHPEHIWRVKKTPATYDKAGKEAKTCIICGEEEEKTLPKLVKNGWFKEKDGWHYYKKNVTQKGWLKDGGKWYYLNSTGVMVTGWLKDSGKWYYLNASGVMVTGWQKINGKWYYLQSSGAMVTGWLKDGGRWYYLNAGGAMVTGWQKISGKWYYLQSSGAMVTGWLKDGGKWYYLDASGAMLASTSKKIGGKTYRFNASGVCTNP